MSKVELTTEEIKDIKGIIYRGYGLQDLTNDKFYPIRLKETLRASKVYVDELRIYFYDDVGDSRYRNSNDNIEIVWKPGKKESKRIMFDWLKGAKDQAIIEEFLNWNKEKDPLYGEYDK